MENDKNDIEEVYLQLREIEAVLSVFSSMDGSVSFEDVAIIANDYLYKLRDIRKKIYTMIMQTNYKP